MNTSSTTNKYAGKQTINILLAEDDLDDCMLFKEALEGISINTLLTIVHDGEQLMNLLNSPAILPNYLFLDLNMPRKNGFECLREIALDIKLKDISIITLTTSSQKDIIAMLYQHNAHYFIRKPNNFKELKALIERAITHQLQLPGKLAN